jgi:AcrR family transcriptional regulator
MGRWEPNARGRLEQAALELYGERGFDETTVREIAERAGLTERTFFRHFADKREVLFPHTNPLQKVLSDALASAPGTLPPLEAVAAALQAGGELIQQRRDVACRRQAVIADHPELRERELIKLAALAAALADGLRRRGVPARTADLAAEAGTAVFKLAFRTWIGESDPPDLPRLLREGLDDLRTLATGHRAGSREAGHDA